MRGVLLKSTFTNIPFHTYNVRIYVYVVVIFTTSTPHLFADSRAPFAEVPLDENRVHTSLYRIHVCAYIFTYILLNFDVHCPHSTNARTYHHRNVQCFPNFNHVHICGFINTYKHIYTVNPYIYRLRVVPFFCHIQVRQSILKGWMDCWLLVWLTDCLSVSLFEWLLFSNI